MKEKSILHLTLSKKPFEVMVTGEKPEEFRKPSKWILSRLKNKDGTDKEYDLVKFVNGYGADKPYFITNYCGWMEKVGGDEVFHYSNGLKVTVCAGDIVIFCDKIIEKGNLK